MIIHKYVTTAAVIEFTKENVNGKLQYTLIYWGYDENLKPILKRKIIKGIYAEEFSERAKRGESVNVAWFPEE